ncbi:MAG: type VI secretion system baseplate subunit TssG [Deferribacterales bacterium]|nr:type VI secretion system baseplate subunit TssG [Deferribacterales bacterium]
MDNVKKLIRKTARKLKNGEGEPDFFELVRRIENIRRDMPPVGKAHTPLMEPIRFGQTPFLKFPETAISEVDMSSFNDETALIYVYFFGLLGVNGPMLLEFTDYILQRSQNHYDKASRRFLDIIHHKMLSLFYRAWATCEQAVNFDRPEEDLITAIIDSIAGSVKGALPLPIWSVLT